MLELDRVVFFGRTWDESLAMYALQAPDLAGKRVLDCPGGPGGLVAGAVERGLDITAVDPQYNLSHEALEAAGRHDVQLTLRLAEADPSLATSPKETAKYARLKVEALESFLVAFKHHPNRFIAGALPALPFEDAAFDLVLSGHLLFTYAPLSMGGIMKANTFDLDFHITAARELVRVGREVRIYPTYAFSGDTRRQPWVEPVMEALRGDGHGVDYVPSQWTQQSHVDFNDCLRVVRRT